MVIDGANMNRTVRGMIPAEDAESRTEQEYAEI